MEAMDRLGVGRSADRTPPPAAAAPGGGPQPAGGMSSGAPTATPLPAEEFVMRIVELEHYMAAPLRGMDACWSELAGCAVQQVPVVRVYGSTPAGQKCCLHLHKAFPYFYLPYSEDLPQDPAEAHWFLNRFALALETALNTASSFQQQHPNQQQHGGPGGGQPPHYPPSAPASPGGCSGAGGWQRVFSVTLVRGTPFYGYHADERVWIKVLMYSPRDVGRAAELLRGGSVMRRAWQPHESHLPYLLQVKIDFNLTGMGWLCLSQARFRVPLPTTVSRQRNGWAARHLVLASEPGADSLLPQLGVQPHSSAGTPGSSASQYMRLWTAGTTPSNWLWGGGGGGQARGAEGGGCQGGGSGRAPRRQSTCQLELDARVEHILNRHQLVRMPLPAAGPEMRMVESLAPMWAEEAARCGASGLPKPPPSPPRLLRTLSHTVHAVQQQFEAIAVQQAQHSGEQPLSQPAKLAQEVAATPAAAADKVPAASPASTARPSPAVHGTPLLALTQPANRARLLEQDASLVFSPLPPLSVVAAAAATVAGAAPQQGRHLAPTVAPSAAAPRQQTPVTPAFALHRQHWQQQQEVPGWQQGGHRPLVDEQLLMTQLTEQQRRRQRWQQQHWSLSQQHREADEEGEGDGEQQPLCALQLDADAWAWLQRRAEGTPADRANGGGGSSDEEDGALLAALAQQAGAFGTPISLQGPGQQQQMELQAAAGGPLLSQFAEGTASQLPGSSPASQQEAALVQAQSALQQLLASNQRECEDILAASQLEQEGREHEEDEQHEEQGQCQQQEAMQEEGMAPEPPLGAAGRSLPTVSPLPFSLSPDGRGAAGPAVAGDIEDIGLSSLPRSRTLHWAGQQQQQEQQQEGPALGAAEMEVVEDEEDAVYLQALQQFEQQQQQGQQQGQAVEGDQAKQDVQPVMVEQQEQEEEHPEQCIPQVDGTADSIQSSTSVSSGPSTSPGPTAGGSQRPSQVSPASQQPWCRQRGRSSSQQQSPGPLQQRFGALTFQSLSPPSKREQAAAASSAPELLQPRRRRELLQVQEGEGQPCAVACQEQVEQPALELSAAGASLPPTEAAAPPEKRPTSGALLASSSGQQQRVAQYNVPGLRRRKPPQQPQHQALVLARASLPLLQQQHPHEPPPRQQAHEAEHQHVKAATQPAAATAEPAGGAAVAAHGSQAEPLPAAALGPQPVAPAPASGSNVAAHVSSQQVRASSQALDHVLAALQSLPPSPDHTTSSTSICGGSSRGGGGSCGGGGDGAGSQRQPQQQPLPHVPCQQVKQGSQSLEEVLSLLHRQEEEEEEEGSEESGEASSSPGGGSTASSPRLNVEAAVGRVQAGSLAAQQERQPQPQPTRGGTLTLLPGAAAVSCLAAAAAVTSVVPGDVVEDEGEGELIIPDSQPTPTPLKRVQMQRPPPPPQHEHQEDEAMEVDAAAGSPAQPKLVVAPATAPVASPAPSPNGSKGSFAVVLSGFGTPAPTMQQQRRRQVEGQGVELPKLPGSTAASHPLAPRQQPASPQRRRQQQQRQLGGMEQEGAAMDGKDSAAAGEVVAADSSANGAAWGQEQSWHHDGSIDPDVSQVPVFGDVWGASGGWDDWEGGDGGGDDFLHLTYPVEEPSLVVGQGEEQQQDQGEEEEGEGLRAVAAEGQGNGSNGGGLAVWRWARLAPTQAQLVASGWELGIAPVVAPQVHYGEPQDAPARPTLFAGREFRVPTSAVQDLPAFTAAVAPRALQHLQQQQQHLPQQQQHNHWRQLLTYVPAQPPPSRATTDAWLQARQRRRSKHRHQAFNAGGRGPNFAMDQNTGHLLPAGDGGSGGKAQRPGSAGGESDATGSGTLGDSLLGDAELLATPSLCTLGSGGGAGTSSKTGTPVSAAALTPTPTPKGGVEAAAGRQVLAAISPAKGGGVSSSEDAEGEGDEEQVQPASPKYDERTFFFSNPFPAFQLNWGARSPSSQRRQHQRELRRQLTTAADPATAPQQQQQQQQPRGGFAGQISSGAPRQTATGIRSAVRPQQQSLLGPSTTPDEQQQQRMGGCQSGSPIGAGQQQQQAQQAGSGLLKSVLRSALKGPAPAEAARGGRGGSQEQQQRWQHSQPSDGSGSKRVSFAVAAAEGDSGSQGPGPSRLSFAAPQQQAQQQASADGGGGSPAAPSPLSAAAAGGTTAATTQPRRAGWVSQITLPSPGFGGSTGATPLSQAGFKQRRCVLGKGQQLTLLSLELHADSRGSLLPDPRIDAVRAVVLAVADDDEEVPDAKYTARVMILDASLASGMASAAAGAAAAQLPPPPPPQQQAPAAASSPSGQPHPRMPPPAGPPATLAGSALQPQAASPGSPRSLALAAGIYLEGMPEPGIAAPPPVASTAEEAMLLLPGGGSSQGAAVGQLLGLASRPIPQVLPGLRNLAAVDALGEDVQVDLYASEAALLGALGAAVAAADPDILLGYEVQRASLGYAAERAAVLGLPSLLRALSRLPRTEGEKEDVGGGSGGASSNPADEFAWQTASGLHCPGRIVLNVWRIMKMELKLTSYTLEACAAAVLQLRVPHVPQQTLHTWFAGGAPGGRWRCLAYWVRRARLSLALLDQLDVVGRTAEMARTFGIDFYSVLSRGSQYRVESMMARLAHTQNYLLVHAGKEQVARQPAMEALPLVMEPLSRLYTDPLVVLDFQSLYPSMVIAYNLCFSTCLGRPAHAAAAGAPLPKLGAIEFGLPPGTLAGALAPERLVVAPNGVAFAPKEARPGVLPRLLSEILSTRIMVKGAMKRAPKSAKVLLRCLNARQFGLKLIANVTYGYTAAGFSGRMPMAELADAIVQSGRETLEGAIRMVEAHPGWRAQVVYGDTDSMFVLLPGRTRAEAFGIGAEIAAAVTAANPPPVVLKMEKVYDPCVLLSKKRYAGFAYESPSQAVPVFDAKGIETVRRDQCPAVAKMMEAVLRLLFTTKDLSRVKEYCERQWSKILARRISMADFVFAKEVRLGTYSAKAAHVPPGALVATRAMARDPRSRAEPRFGERVPYMVVHGEPGARLFELVLPPRAVVEGGGKAQLNGLYYITKAIIPALDRVLSLVGADCKAWFAEMARPARMLPQKRPTASLPLLAAFNATVRQSGMLQAVARARTIDRYYLSRHCAVCDALTHATKPLCNRCASRPQLAATVLTSRWNRLERQHAQLVRLCAHCGGSGRDRAVEGGIVCDSLDCGIYFERRKVHQELAAAVALAQAGLQLLEEEAQAQVQAGGE